jgi:hypothetical protein
VANAPLPATFGEQRTAVLLVTFAQNPVTPYTLADVRQLVFGTTSDYYRENSYGQTWLAGEVYGWYTIALTNTCSIVQISALAREAAAAAGVSLSSFTRYVYVFPRQACGWAGVGTLGGQPSEAWINGNPALRVVAHELGHNVGLYHSHALGWRQPLACATCLSTEYGDTVDIMGAAAMIQDVTARWERDKALRAELASLKNKVAQLEAMAPAGKAEGA